MGTPPPDDLPKSPTGRIPRWVVDEAMGRPVEAPGFRAYGTPDPLATVGRRRPRRARRWLSALLAIAILSGLVYVARTLGLSASSVPVAGTRPSNAPAPGNEEAAAPLGTPPASPAPAAGGYRFAATQADGTAPVAWSPCRPIHYVVRSANQPRGGDRAIADAVAAVSAATGLQFVSDGETSEGPSEQRSPYQPDRYGDRWAPVLIAWATPDEVPDFGIDIAGEAGPVRVGTPDGDPAYVSGVVYLDPAKYRRAVSEVGRAVADTVILHELGHLVGLAHVNDPAQVMWPRGNGTGITTFQAGDRAGLAALGRGACQPDV